VAAYHQKGSNDSSHQDSSHNPEKISGGGSQEYGGTDFERLIFILFSN